MTQNTEAPAHTWSPLRIESDAAPLAATNGKQDAGVTGMISS